MKHQNQQVTLKSKWQKWWWCVATEEGDWGVDSVLRSRQPTLFAFSTITIIWIITTIIIITSFHHQLSTSPLNSYYPYHQSVANKRSRELFAPTISPPLVVPPWYPLDNPLRVSKETYSTSDRKGRHFYRAPPLSLVLKRLSLETYLIIRRHFQTLDLMLRIFYCIFQLLISSF